MRTSRWVLWTYITIILVGIVLALPNDFTKAQLDAMPSWFPKKQVALGLDLRGGSYLVLEVDAAALKKDRISSILDDTRGHLRTAKIQPQSVRVAGDSVIVTLADATQSDAAVTALRDLTTQVAQVGFAAPVSDIDITTNDNQIRLTLTEAGMKDKLDNALAAESGNRPSPRRSGRRCRTFHPARRLRSYRRSASRACRIRASFALCSAARPR